MPEVALKKAWTRVAFGEVVQLSRERSSDPEGDGFERYVGLEHIDPGDLKIRRWGDIADGTTFTSVFRPGQVLFGKRRAYQRKVAVADFSGVCSGDIYVLEPKNSILLPELLPFICQTDGFFEHAVGTSAGSLSPRTNWDSLATYEFALPPLEEQRRIAEALGAVELAYNTVLQLAKAAVYLYDSLLESCFGLRQAGAGIGLSDVNVSDGWRNVPLRTVANVHFSNVDKKTVASEKTIHLCNYMDVYTNDYIKSDMPFMGATATEREIERFALHRGDIIITKDSETPDDIGVPAMVVEDMPGVLCGYHLAMLRPKAQLLNSRFLFHYLRSSRVRSRFCQMANGITRYGLPSGAVLDLTVWLPSINEQVKVADRLDQCRESEAAARLRSASYASIKKRMLRSLL